MQRVYAMVNRLVLNRNSIVVKDTKLGKHLHKEKERDRISVCCCKQVHILFKYAELVLNIAYKMIFLIIPP